VRGLKGKEYQSSDDEDEDKQQEDDHYEAVVEMPDNDENSINIKINNKKLFPVTKPPMPLKSVLKNAAI